MKSLIIIFGTLLLIIATPFVFESIDNALTDEYSQSFASVSTGAGEYAANVTLSREPHNEDTNDVTEISSNISSDSPSASDYNTVSKSLEVSGLVESEERTLTVEFYIDSVSLPASMVTFMGLLRWFYVFIIIGMSGGAIYAFFD